MDTQAFWTLFFETGAPEVYLAYKQAMENDQADTACA
jgi:hypothetical protein